MSIFFLLIGIALAFSVSVALLLDQSENFKHTMEKYTDDVNILFEEKKK